MRVENVREWASLLTGPHAAVLILIGAVVVLAYWLDGDQASILANQAQIIDLLTEQTELLQDAVSSRGE